MGPDVQQRAEHEGRQFRLWQSFFRPINSTEQPYSPSNGNAARRVGFLTDCAELKNLPDRWGGNLRSTS
jgi:hypothetical protein